MNIEQHRALQEHIQAIAKILYEETPAGELKTLGGIEQAVCRQMQQHALPQIGIFYPNSDRHNGGYRWTLKSLLGGLPLSSRQAEA